MDGKNLHNEQPLLPDVDKAWSSMLYKLNKEMPVTGNRTGPSSNVLRWIWFAGAVIALVGFLFFTGTKNRGKIKPEKLEGTQNELKKDIVRSTTKQNDERQEIRLSDTSVIQRTINDTNNGLIKNKENVSGIPSENTTSIVSKTAKGNEYLNEKNKLNKKEVAVSSSNPANEGKNAGSGKSVRTVMNEDRKMKPGTQKIVAGKAARENAINKRQTASIRGINASRQPGKASQNDLKRDFQKRSSTENDISVLSETTRNIKNEQRRRVLFIPHDSLPGMPLNLKPVKIVHDSSSIIAPVANAKKRRPSVSHWQAGLEENIVVPLQGSSDYFTGPSGNSNPVRSFMPALWVQYGNKHYSVLAEAGSNYSTSFSSSPYFLHDSMYNTGSIRDTFSLHTSKTMVKAFGFSFSLNYSRILSEHFSVSAGVQASLYSSGLVKEASIYKNSGLLYKDSIYRAPLADWDQFYHMQVNGTIGALYSFGRFGLGGKIIIPVNKISNKGYKGPLGAEIVLRLRLAGK